MFRIIFPSRFDNSFHGHKAALWLFYLITVMTLGRSLVHIFLAGTFYLITVMTLGRSLVHIFLADGGAPLPLSHWTGFPGTAPQPWSSYSHCGGCPSYCWA